MPQLLEQSTLERQRSADFSSRLADVQGVPVRGSAAGREGARARLKDAKYTCRRSFQCIMQWGCEPWQAAPNLPASAACQHAHSLYDVQLVPHVIPPHVVPERPPLPEARLRLEARLDMYGLVERQVKGDGNCQFRWVWGWSSGKSGNSNCQFRWSAGQAGGVAARHV